MITDFLALTSPGTVTSDVIGITGKNHFTTISYTACHWAGGVRPHFPLGKHGSAKFLYSGIVLTFRRHERIEMGGPSRQGEPERFR